MGYGGAGERVAAAARSAAYRCGRVALLLFCGARRCLWEPFRISGVARFFAVRHGQGRPGVCARFEQVAVIAATSRLVLLQTSKVCECAARQCEKQFS